MSVNIISVRAFHFMSLILSQSRLDLDLELILDLGDGKEIGDFSFRLKLNRDDSSRQPTIACFALLCDLDLVLYINALGLGLYSIAGLAFSIWLCYVSFVFRVTFLF